VTEILPLGNTDNVSESGRYHKILEPFRACSEYSAFSWQRCRLEEYFSLASAGLAGDLKNGFRDRRAVFPGAVVLL